MRLTEELEQRVKNVEDTLSKEIDALQREVQSSVREAGEATARAAATVAEITADKEVAVREVQQVAGAAAAATDQKLLALEKEAGHLRRRLEIVPGELRAEYEKNIDERERRAREEVRSQVRVRDEQWRGVGNDSDVTPIARLCVKCDDSQRVA